jgi:predicted DNA binding CopG/RHH family protein
MKRQVPKMTTDEEAEAFLASDLSDLDFTQFKPVRFRFSTKSAPKKGRSRTTVAATHTFDQARSKPHK